MLAHRFLDPIVDGGDAAEDTRKVGTADAPAHLTRKGAANAGKG